MEEKKNNEAALREALERAIEQGITDARALRGEAGAVLNAAHILKVNILSRVEAALSLSSPIEPPSVEWSRSHLAHVQRFLCEMYQTMVDPIDEFRGNIAELCALLLSRAREDREALSQPPQASSEIREHIYDYDVESTGRSVNHSDSCWCRAGSRQGATK